MTIHTSPDDDQHAQEMWLRQFLAWLIPIVFGFVALLTIIFIILEHSPAGVAALVLLGYGILLLVVRFWMRPSRSEAAVMLVCTGLFLTIIVIKLFEPSSPATLAVAPLLAVAIALPYTNRSTLRDLLIVCWLTSTTVAVLNEIGAPVVGLPLWLSIVLRAGSFAAVVALLLLLLWQFHGRLTRALARAQMANAALRESEARYRIVSELTSDYIYAMRVTHDGQVMDTWATDAFARATGYVLASLETRDAWMALIHPDDTPIAQQQIALFRSGQESVRELRLITKTGEIRWVRHYVRPLRDEGSERGMSIIGAVQDITERKRTEDALRESEERFRTLVGSMDDIVFTLDREQRHTGVFGRWLDRNGLSPDMFLGKTAGDIFGAEAAPIHEQANQRALAGENVVYEWMIRSPEGTRYFQTSLSPLHDSQEAIVGVVGIGREITERKREEEARLALERRLQEAKKLESLAALAGGIAHDFNNLLAIILGNVDLARFEIPPDSPAQELLPPIVGAVQRATALTQQMLAYSGRGHFQVERLDLNELLNEMREPLQAAIGGQAVLIYQLAPERLLLAADTSQIRQAILNLAINAAEAIGGARGSITIRTGLRHVDWAYLTETYLAPDLAEGRYVYLEVADTGSGMDDATRARIFEPFFTTKFMGRGLGLAAVLGIVRGHQGAIQVRSAPGQGATFALLFPTADDRPHPAEEPASSSVGGRLDPRSGRGRSPALSGGEGSAGGAVLIVDDEEGIRTMAARVLEQAGYSVLTAADGRTAVEVFRANADQIVCVLLDLMLPHTTGDVIFRQIRRIKQDTCVILMSGYDEQEMTSRFAGQEPAGFLQKPFSPDQLRDTLRRLLGEA